METPHVLLTGLQKKLQSSSLVKEVQYHFKGQTKLQLLDLSKRPDNSIKDLQTKLQPSSLVKRAQHHLQEPADKATTFSLVKEVQHHLQGHADRNNHLLPLKNPTSN